MELKIIEETFFPSYMLNYCEYGDRTNLTDEDIQLYENWLKENHYEYYSCDTDNEEIFINNPPFGLPCMTYPAYFQDISTSGMLEAMQKANKDKHPLNITFRRDKHTKEIIMVYQENHAYDPTVKVCYTLNESHGSISKDYYREDTIPAEFEEYEDTLNTILRFYPEDNYRIVKHINWTK